MRLKTKRYFVDTTKMDSMINHRWLDYLCQGDSSYVNDHHHGYSVYARTHRIKVYCGLKCMEEGEGYWEIKLNDKTCKHDLNSEERTLAASDLAALRRHCDSLLCDEVHVERCIDRGCNDSDEDEAKKSCDFSDCVLTSCGNKGARPIVKARGLREKLWMSSASVKHFKDSKSL